LLLLPQALAADGFVVLGTHGPIVCSFVQSTRDFASARYHGE
jgi:hypothetical protein